MTATECESDFKLTTDTPYLALIGELWRVNYVNCLEHLPRYNNTALYLALSLDVFISNPHVHLYSATVYFLALRGNIKCPKSTNPG